MKRNFNILIFLLASLIHLKFVTKFKILSLTELKYGKKYTE